MHLANKHRRHENDHEIGHLHFMLSYPRYPKGPAQARLLWIRVVDAPGYKDQQRTWELHACDSVCWAKAVTEGA